MLQLLTSNLKAMSVSNVITTDKLKENSVNALATPRTSYSEDQRRRQDLKIRQGMLKRADRSAFRTMARSSRPGITENRGRTIQKKHKMRPLKQVDLSPKRTPKEYLVAESPAASPSPFDAFPVYSCCEFSEMYVST